MRVKVFFMFSTKLWFTWAGIILLSSVDQLLHWRKKAGKPHAVFFSVCAYSEGGNEITCRRSKSKGKKNVRELGQDLQENVPFLRTKCIVGKKVAFSRNCYPNGKRTYQVCFETWCPLFQMKFKIIFIHETLSVDFQRLCSTWLTLSNAEILRQRDLHNHMSAVRFLA